MRRRCQFCRLVACYEAGMKSEFVQKVRNETSGKTQNTAIWLLTPKAPKFLQNKKKPKPSTQPHCSKPQIALVTATGPGDSQRRHGRRPTEAGDPQAWPPGMASPEGAEALGTAPRPGTMAGSDVGRRPHPDVRERRQHCRVEGEVEVWARAVPAQLWKPKSWTVNLQPSSSRTRWRPACRRSRPSARTRRTRPHG